MRNFFAKLRGVGTVTVNGRSYTGASIEVVNGTVVVDGRKVDGMASSPKLEISIQGDVVSLEMGSGSVNVSGSVGESRLRPRQGDLWSGERQREHGVWRCEMRCHCWPRIHHFWRCDLLEAQRVIFQARDIPGFLSPAPSSM